MPSQRITRQGAKDLEPVYFRALPAIDATMARAEPNFIGPPYIAHWRGMSIELLLVAFHNCAVFPSLYLLASMGFANALCYYAIIAATRDFTPPTKEHDERWRSVLALKLGSALSGSFDIPALGDDGLFESDPIATVEQLFNSRNRLVRADDDSDWTCTSAPGSDEARLFKLFSPQGSSLRSPVGELVATGPDTIDDSAGTLASHTRQLALSRRTSTQKATNTLVEVASTSTLPPPPSARTKRRGGRTRRR